MERDSGTIDMTSETRDLEEEHQQLGQAWLAAEQERVALLQGILKAHVGKCTMDYPDGLFADYEAALGKAAAAHRAYAQWLAEQGIQSR